MQGFCPVHRILFTVSSSRSIKFYRVVWVDLQTYPVGCQAAGKGLFCLAKQPAT